MPVIDVADSKDCDSPIRASASSGAGLMSKSQSKESKDDKQLSLTIGGASRARSPNVDFNLDDAKDDSDTAISAEAKAAAKVVSDAKHAHRRRTESKLDDTSDTEGAPDVLSEDEETAAVEREFQALLNAPNAGDVFISTDRVAKEIVEGLEIMELKMKDATSSRLLWQGGGWGDNIFFTEIEARIPKEILRCRAVSRELVFHSDSIIKKFRLEQRVYLQGVCIEEHFFNFGFVIPGSTNTWEQTIVAAPPDKMLPAEILSGKVTFEIAFYDDKLLLCKTLFRIYYE